MRNGWINYFARGAANCEMGDKNYTYQRTREMRNLVGLHICSACAPDIRFFDMFALKFFGSLGPEKKNKCAKRQSDQNYDIAPHKRELRNQHLKIGRFLGARSAKWLWKL